MPETTALGARLMPPLAAMGLVILASNILVQYPVEAGLAGLNLADWLTYGAFTYPVAFLVTDTTNRLFGPAAARRIVYAGFALGVVLSLVFADARIAAASGTAFLIAQLLDVTVFDRLRRASWWKAPLASSLLGSAVDTALFFAIAFAGTGLPWAGWATGDFAAKLVMALVLLPVFRGLVAVYPRALRDGQPAA